MAAVEGASSEAFVTRVGAVLQGLGFGSDEATRAELYQHLAGGADWLGDTLQFLWQRAQAHLLQQACAPQPVCAVAVLDTKAGHPALERAG